MRKNFTQLINRFTHSKKLVVALTSLMILAGSLYLYAAVGVTVTGGGTFPVTADLAANATLTTPGYTSVGTIAIQEAVNSDFASSGNIVLRAPAGWRFRGSGVTANVAIFNDNGGVSIATGTIAYSADGSVITIPLTVSGTNKREQITISGVQVQALDGTNMPGTGNIRIEVSNGAVVSGLPATLTQSISQRAGTARALVFNQQPTTTSIYTAISPAPTVLIKDQFGNTVTNATNSVSLAIGNNAGSGVLTTGAALRSNGEVSFTGYSIDAAGSNYTLVASSGSLTPATSSIFNITSSAPVLDQIIAGCLTIGSGEQTITLRGSNFARNASGRVGSSLRPTTFVSSTELRMTLLESDLAVAGNKSVNVYNPAPSAAASASQIVVVHNIVENLTISGSTVSPMCTGSSRTYSGPADYTDYEWSVSAGAAITSATANTNSVSIRYNDVAPASGKVTITIKAKNPCGVASSQSFDILVNQTPPAVITYDTPVIYCEGSSVVLKAPMAPSGEDPYRYEWLFNGITIPDATSSTYRALEAGGYRVRVTGSDPNNCSNISSTTSVSITSPLTQGAISGGTSYCHNATVASADRLTATVEGGTYNDGNSTRPKTYLWEQSANGSTGWEPAAGANTSSVYTPSTAETGTTYYRRTVYAGGCENTTEPVAVLVKPNPVTTVNADNAAICQGESVKLTATGADSYVWSVGGVPLSSSDAEITVTPAVTTTYTVVGWTNDCKSVSQTITITVTPTLTQGAIQGATQYCQVAGGTGTNLTSTVTGGITAKTYQWEQSVNGSTGWVEAVGTNNTANYTPSIGTAGTMHYRRVVTSGSCTSIGDPIAVTVTPAVTNEISEAQVVCSGDPIQPLTGTFTGGDPADVSYLWEQSPNGSSSWTEASGANTGANYAPATENVTTTKTTYYRRKVVSGNCTLYSNTVSVRITARPVAAITQGTNTYFCPTGSPGTAALTASLSGASYAWYKVGETEPVGDARTIYVSEAGEYFVEVTLNNCSSTSEKILVQETVVNNNVLNSQNQVVCYGGTPETLIGTQASSRFNNVTYQWQQKTSEEGNFTNISGATNPDLVLGAHTADRWYRRIAAEGSCAIYSNEIYVEVKPELKVTNIPTAATSVCNNTLFQFDPVGSVAGATFAWTRAAVEGISNPAITNGGGGINETLVNTSSAPIDVTYIYTTSGNENCTGEPQNLVVRVNPTPLLSSTLMPAAVCSGTAFDYTATSATTGTTYSWVRKPAQGITTGAAESGNTARVNHTLTNTTTDPIDVTYTYTLTINGCSNTQDVVVTVNPRPQLSSTLAPDAVCSGATFSYSPQSETAGATFSWTRLSATGITSSDPTSGTGSVSQTLVNTTANPINVTYRYTTNANECSGSVENVVVTVNPSPKLSTPLTASVCSGNTFSYEPASPTAGATFSWTRAASGGNAASSGTENISEVLTNTTTSPITVTYEIITRANSCDGVPQNLVVTINPRPVLSSALLGSVCSGSAFTYTPTSATAGATYAWTRAAVAGITSTGATSGSGAINQTLVNTTSDPIDVTYVYTTTANSCAGSEQNLVVTVNPQPVLSSTLAPSAICSGTTFSYTPASATEGATFSWTRLSAAGITSDGGTSGTGAVNQNLTNSGTAPVNVTYRYTTTANSCAGSSTQDVVVVVNPSPKLSSPLTASVCSGTAFSYTPTSTTTGTTFTWERQPVADITIEGPASGTGSINQTFTNTTSSFVNVTYRVTSTANNCIGPTENVVVRVNPKPVATFVGKIGTAEVGSTIYSDGGNVTFTPTGATGGTFSIVSPSGLAGFSTSGSTATLDPCTALGTVTSKPVTIRYTVNQGSGINQCTNTEEMTFTLKRSIYTVIVLADPYPTCRGQITEYTAYIYKDATRVIYPYLADENGIAVDRNGNKLPDTTLPITNPDYPFPNRENMPQVSYDNAWRYFQPIVEGGTLMPASNFNYSWTKNQQNFIGANSPTFKNAGLSSMDYYSVQATSKNSACAQPITSKLGNRMYTSATVNYEVALTSDKSTICQGEVITLTADLNDAFGFWSDISLSLYWMLDRGGVITQLGETVYKSGDNIQFPTSGPAGGFLDGDKLFIEFSSALDQYNNANKCARGFITNIIPVTVVGEQTMNGGGAYCAGGTGMPVGINGSQQNVLYQLKRDGVAVGSPVTGTGNAISFGSQTVGGAYTVEAIARTGTNACLVFGPVNVNVTPLPVVQTLNGGGAYCAGETGVPVTLASSQTGVKYQLQRTVNGTTSNVGLEVLGSDGQPIPFGNQTVAGVYSVLATTLPSAGTVAACPRPMGNVTVVVNPLPIAQTLTGGGSYCAGGAGMPVGLQNSQSGITYRLKDNVGQVVATVTGTGSAISFGSFPAGSYIAEAENGATTCSSAMTGSITVTEIALPTVFSMNGGGSYCADADGVPVGLDGSQTGINYQLRRTVDGSTVNVGNPVSGTGSAISFGNQTVAGTYSILATTAAAPGCPRDMGSREVIINALPLANRMVNNQSYCSLASNGARITMNNPEAGVTYQLVGTNPPRSFSTDANGDLSIDEVPAGTYTIRGVNSVTGCTTPSVGTVTVTDTKKTDAFGDITHKWVGKEKWELTAVANQVPGVTIPANATYNWFVKYPDAAEFTTYPGSTQTVIVENLPVGTEVIARVFLTDGDCQMVIFVPNEIIPLPVELLFFNATRRGNDAVLDWATASEQDNMGFEVQVSSDAKNFRKLGFVKSRVGTTSLKQAYSFVDEENGKHGTRYYRLKQIDLDGKFEFFSIKAVQFGEVTMNKVKAYPNPFHSEVELSIDAELDGELQITVTTATGQQLLQRTVQVARGTNTEKLVLDPKLPRGVYIISTRMGDFNGHFKLLKQ